MTAAVPCAPDALPVPKDCPLCEGLHVDTRDWDLSCPECGRKHVSIFRLEPDEFGRRMAAAWARAYRAIIKEFVSDGE